MRDTTTNRTKRRKKKTNQHIQIHTHVFWHIHSHRHAHIVNTVSQQYIEFTVSMDMAWLHLYVAIFLRYWAILLNQKWMSSSLVHYLLCLPIHDDDHGKIIFFFFIIGLPAFFNFFKSLIIIVVIHNQQLPNEINTNGIQIKRKTLETKEEIQKQQFTFTRMCINCVKKKARSSQGEWDKDKHRKNEKKKIIEETEKI